MNIINFRKTYIAKPYMAISLLGKSYKLTTKYTSSNNISLTKKDSEFILSLPKKYKNLNNQDLVFQATEKLYTEFAPKEIEDSLELARHILKFAPDDYKIEKLDNSFYKSIKRKILVISPDIIQYSKEIINTTMIQEFCKMKHNQNSKIYKQELKNALIEYENYKKNNINSEELKLKAI